MPTASILLILGDELHTPFLVKAIHVPTQSLNNDFNKFLDTPSHAR